MTSRHSTSGGRWRRWCPRRSRPSRSWFRPTRLRRVVTGGGYVVGAIEREVGEVEHGDVLDTGDARVLGCRDEQLATDDDTGAEVVDAGDAGCGEAPRGDNERGGEGGVVFGDCVGADDVDVSGGVAHD